MKKRRKAFDTALKKPVLSISVLIILLCVILCSSLLFIGSAFYWNSYDLMVNQYQESVQRQVSLYLSGVEEEISTIEQAQRSLLNNGDLLYLRNAKIASINFDMASAINRLIAQIITVQESNQYIKSLFLHLDSLERTLSSTPCCLLSRTFSSYLQNVHNFLPKMAGNLLQFPACLHCYSFSIACRTSSRSRRLILSSIVSVLVVLKCAHTR